MYPGSKVVKITAKTALKKNYFKSVFTVAILLFAHFIAVSLESMIYLINKSFLPVIALIVFSFFITLPILLGAFRYFWRILFGMDDNPISLFYYFSEKSLYKKALKFVSVLLFKVVRNAFLLFIPALLVYLISGNFIYDTFNIAIPLWAGKLQNLCIFFTNLALVVLPLTFLKFYMAPVLFVADENMDAGEAFHLSAQISKKNIVEFIVFNFSFIGWILLSIFIFPLLFILPYYLTSYAVHTRFVIAEYNKKSESGSKFGGEYYAV